ncbi:MAG TPA: hypothetical protein VGF33_07560 [Caulobacteraceae bacterium]
MSLARTSETAVTQGQIYAICILALIANAVAKTVIAVAAQEHAGALAQGLGLSWAFWLSFALCVRLALISEPTPARPKDWLVATVCVLVAATPIGPASSAAATGLGLWLIFNRSSESHLKAAGMVLLAITVNLLWGRLLMAFFAAPVAALDARLVGLIVHTQVQNNTVWMLDSRHRFMIIEACTSVENASVALMMFVAIVRTFRSAPKPKEMLYLGAVFAFVVAVNDARLSLMARSPDMFELVHGPASWAALNAIFTIAGLVGAAMCVRREILA